jgi:putative transposase
VPICKATVRWRCVDLQHRIKQNFGVSFHERTVGKLLNTLSFRRLTVRPQHPKSDPEAQAAFQAEFPALVAAALPPEAAGKPVEIWFGDEARVGQQGTLTRLWARRGTRPRAPQDRRFQSAHLFGAVCPERKSGAAIVMPDVNIDAMNEHLAAISRSVSAGAIAVLVLDNAGWHTSTRLVLPDNIVLLPLPP